MKRRFKVGDLVIAYKDSLGIIVGIHNEWYHYYKFIDELIFNTYDVGYGEFKGVHFGNDCDFQLIERGNTRIT